MWGEAAKKGRSEPGISQAWSGWCSLAAWPWANHSISLGLSLPNGDSEEQSFLSRVVIRMN